MYERRTILFQFEEIFGLVVRHLSHLPDSVRKRLKHITPALGLPPVKAEGVLVQVGLQIFGAGVAINAANPILGESPETFNRVRMHVAINIDALRMIDAPVTKS